MNHGKVKGRQVNLHYFMHDARREGDNVKARKNEEINPELTRLNYSLLNSDGKCSAKADYDNYRKRLSQLEKFNRNDVNTLVEGVFTIPGPLRKCGDEFERRTFETVLDFVSERYGKENIISANVHLDEKSHHLHYKFIPVALNRNGKESVCCKKVHNKMDLASLHPDCGKYLDKHFPLTRNGKPYSWIPLVMIRKYQSYLASHNTKTNTEYVRSNISFNNFKFHKETKDICEAIFNTFNYIEDYNYYYPESTPSIREYINSLIKSNILDKQTAEEILDNYIKMGYNIDGSVNQLEMG